MKNHPKNQHYVPQFLLRNFKAGEGDFIWCFDKTTEKHFTTHISNIAFEKYFYDFVPGNASSSMEYLLSDLEGVSSNIIYKVLSNNNLGCLSSDEKYNLAFFIAMQFIRTKSAELRRLKLINVITKKLSENTGIDYRPDLSEAQNKEAFLSSLSDAETYIPYIINKFWCLMKSNAEFIVSDNPIVLQNEFHKDSLRGGLGLNSLGIEIFMPLSKDIVLYMLCEKTYENLKSIEASNFSAQEFLFQLNTGLINLKPEHIERINSLQVVYSERFVMSHKEDFNLVREMIKMNDT